MASYKFVDHWYIKAPIDQVFHTIADATTYPQWWPVYARVERVSDIQSPNVGSRGKLVVKSALGYKLRIEVEITESNPPISFKTISHGDLEGTGDWVLEQHGDTTHATWTWIVESHHPLLNLLEPVAKRLFAWSHNDASRKGHYGLKKFLEQSVAIAH